MAGAPPKLVTRETLLGAQKQLQIAVNRLGEAVKLMLDADIDSIPMRATTALGRGVTEIVTLSRRAVQTVEDAATAAELGVLSKAELTRIRYARYGKKTTGKEGAKPPARPGRTKKGTKRSTGK